MHKTMKLTRTCCCKFWLSVVIVATLSITVSCGNRADVAKDELLRRNIDLCGSSLVRAAAHGDIDVLELFIAAGIDHETIDKALVEAVRFGVTSSARTLLNNGSDANAKNAEKIPILAIAVRNNDLNTVELLLKHNADTTTLVPDSKRTVLVDAIYRANIDASIIRELVVSGSEIDNVDRFGYTPLMHAVFVGNDRATEILLSGGAEVNAQSTCGETALDIASYKGAYPLADLIMSYGGIRLFEADGVDKATDTYRYNVPKEATHSCKAVKIQVLNKSTGDDETFTIELGKEVIVSEGMTVKATAFIPYFAMQKEDIVYVSDEPVNPAARLTVRDCRRIIFSGWIFSKFPNTNDIRDAKYSIRLKGWI